MSKIDQKLYHAKYGNDPVAYFEHLPDVESVEVFQDEIKVNYKRDAKHIFPQSVQYGRCSGSELKNIGRSVIIPVKVKRSKSL